MSTKETPKVAVVGGGYWGKNLIRNFFELGVLKVICDSDPAKLQEYRQKYPGVLTSQSFAQVVQDPEIQGVVIAVPAELHFELAREVIISGKDVFVEKPLSLRVEDGEKLVELSREKKKILMIGHILAYHPAVVRLKELIGQGDLGRIQYVYSNRLNLGKIRTEENILWSFAPHDISTILSLLQEMPVEVIASGGNYLHASIADVTITALRFPSGVRAHIFVSWLHPYKEQRLVVVGEKKMAVFDDMAQDKLVIYPHGMDWVERSPVPRKGEAQAVPISNEEPLRRECRHFLDCLQNRATPRTDGEEGLRVLKVLSACSQSLQDRSRAIELEVHPEKSYFVHPSAVIDPGCSVGPSTRIWHYSHLVEGARIGRGCSIGQNVFIGRNVQVGNNVKIQNNVSVYEGVTLEDNVFCGPSMVFTNVINPRSEVSRKHEFKPTRVGKGATLGANSTVVCGTSLGAYAFVGAGAVVTRDVPDYALVYGNPARVMGWVCRCGEKLELKGNRSECRACGLRYQKSGTKLKPLAAGTRPKKR